MEVEHENFNGAVNDNSFNLTFEATSPLRILVDVVSNVLNRVEFKILKSSEQEGIHIESIDAKQICLIVAQLGCKVLGNPSMINNTKFCVDTSVFNTCLKAVPQHYSIDIKNEPDSSDVVLSAYESLSQTYTSAYKIPTLLNEAEPVSLSDLSYNYTIEMDLSTLRTIVKNTIALKGSDITFRVEEPEQDASSGGRHTILSILSEGQAKQHHMFHSVTDTKDNASCIIRTDQAEIDTAFSSKKLVKKYEEVFSANYINYFLKSMERHIITMRLSPGKPLILNYSLGNADSYICFVLAPRNSS